MKQGFFHLSPEKRDAIISASLAEFGAQDFDAASLDRIVASAGISKGGLYQYIASKEDLYIFCMEKTWSSLYRFITEQVFLASTPFPSDILDRFMTVARIAIEWYLRNPAMLGLIVRIPHLPHDALNKKAEAVFDRHFSELFSTLDTSQLAYPVEPLIDLIKWLLAKTRKDVLQEITAGRPPDEVRRTYLEQWSFMSSVLGHGIYQRA